MKSLFKSAVFASAALFTVVGCSNNSLSTDRAQKVHFVLHADTPQTKTGVMNDNGSYLPYWNKGDELGVIFTLPSSNGDLKKADAFFINTSETGDEAAFEGDVTLSDGEGITFYSFYPASSVAKSYKTGDVITIGLDVTSEQSPSYDAVFGYSFDPKADILIAKPATCMVVDASAVNEVDMYFARLSSVLRIELDALSSAVFYGEVVKSFKIETFKGEIAGRIAVNPQTGEYSNTNATNTSKVITATYDTVNGPVSIGKDGENNVFLSVAPVTINKGSAITVTVETVTSSGAAGHTLVKTITTTSDIVFESSKPTVLKLALSDENIYHELTTTPASGETLSWKADEYGEDNAKTITVSQNWAASGYSVSASDSNWNVSDDGNGTITVYPVAANTGTTEADIKTLDLLITHKDDVSLTSTITLEQTYSGAPVSYFVKVESTPEDWTGTYLIVYETGKVAFNGALTKLDDTKNTVEVTITDNKIEATDKLLKSAFTIDGTNGSIKSASGYYIGRNANSNGLDSSTSKVYTNTLSISSGNFEVKGKGGAFLRYNASSDQNRFRYFKSDFYSSQKAIQLYKLTE